MMTSNTILEVNFYILIISTLWMIIKSKLSFKSQRISALLIPVIGVLIWAIKPLLLAKEMVYTSTVLTPINILPAVSNFSISPVSIISLSGIYGVVSGLLMVYFIFKISKVLWFFKDATTQGKILLKTSSILDSFSFFKFIHLRAGMDDSEQQVVMQHELIHYQKHHSLDLVLMEIFHSLFWINPLFFYLKKELVNIHEFEVDQEMYKTHKTNYMRHLLNYALGSVDSHYLLTSPFYNRLTLTKRINTMKSNKNNNNIWLLLTIPLLTIALAFVACSHENELENPLNSEDIMSNVNAPDILPEFNGGKTALFFYLNLNTKYPENAKKRGIEGKAMVEITVDADGKIKDIFILNKPETNPIDSELAQEAIRLVMTMPRWIPASKAGKNVAYTMVLPIIFQLVNDLQQVLLGTHKETGEKIFAPNFSKPPVFKGGEQEMYAFFTSNIIYPESSKKEGFEGRVYLTFLVTKTGAIEQIKILKGLNHDLDQEALRVINLMPNWEPAEKDGKTVAVQFTLPISFQLSD